jgi:O-antigen/teichoic acid export membrane protein
VSVRKNMTSLLLSQLLMWVVTFVLIIEAPNRLGKAAWGDLGYATAFVGFFALVAGLGANTLLTREIARDHTLMRQLVYNALALKLVIVAILPLIGLALAYLLGSTNTVLLLIAINFIGMTAQVLAEITTGALAGVEVMGPPAFFQVIQVYVSNLLGILLLLLGFGVVAYALVFAVATYIPLILSVPLVRRQIHRTSRPAAPRAHLDKRTWRFLIRGGVPLMTLTVFNLIYGTVDIPILGFITDNITIGYYTLAQKWVGIPVFISTAVVAAYFPRFSAHGHPMTDEFPKLVNKAVRIVMLAAVPCAVGLAFVAEDLVTLLYHGDFRPAIPVMRILAPQVPLAAMDTVLATALIASNRMRSYLYVSIGAAIFNPLACIVLIHWSANRYGNGAIGAAIVTVLTELIIMIAALVLKSPGVLDRTATRLCIGTILAALLMAPGLLLFDSWPLFVKVAFGVVTYGVGLLLFRAVTVDEIRSLVASFASRRRRVPTPID